MRTTRKRGGKQSTAPSERPEQRVMLSRLAGVFQESLKRLDDQEQHGPVRIYRKVGTQLAPEDDDSGGIGAGLKLTIGLTGSFLLGTIFWAGAIYNQIVEMKSELTDIKSQMPALARVAIIEDRQNSFRDQLMRMQEQLDKVKRIVE